MLRTSLNQRHRDQGLTGARSTSGQHFEKKKNKFLCLMSSYSNLKRSVGHFIGPCHQQGYLSEGQGNLDYFVSAVS